MLNTLRKKQNVGNRVTWPLLALSFVLVSACATTNATTAQCPLRTTDNPANSSLPAEMAAILVRSPGQDCTVVDRNISAEGKQILRLSCANGRTGFLVGGFDSKPELEKSTG